MSRDTRLKIGILVFTALVGKTLLVAQGMTFSPFDNLAAAGVVGVLAPVAMFYHQRQTAEFVMSLSAIMFLMVFTSCFTVLMYGAAALGMPLIDGHLMAFDAALGVHLPSIVAWAQEHRLVATVLQLAYHTTILQTFLATIVLGFAGQRRELEGFVLAFMLSLVATAALFCIFPAEGPFVAYGYEPSEAQARYLEHLQTLRSGERTGVVLKEAEGLVTFPSFHTAWAILLVYAFRNCRRWLPWIAIVNAMVLVATLTSGWHYFADVLGGVVLAAATIWGVKRLQQRLYADASEVCESCEEAIA